MWDEGIRVIQRLIANHNMKLATFPEKRVRLRGVQSGKYRGAFRKGTLTKLGILKNWAFALRILINSVALLLKESASVTPKISTNQREGNLTLSPTPEAGIA